MNVTHALDLDMQLPSARQTMYAKQDDSLTRTAVLTLYNGGSAFDVSDAEILQIAFFKPDKTGGLYDTMPDGSFACAVAENVVTAQLHPQMFTAAGRVICELRMLTNNGMRLSTFSWIIFVEAAVTNGIKSESYYRFASLDRLRTELTAMIQAGPPVAFGESEDGAAYTAEGDDLPAAAASFNTYFRQILFVPQAKNTTQAPTLAINGGEAFKIQLRADKNQGENDQFPDVKQPVPVGTLMRGVPYLLTFSGSAWFIDSMIGGTRGNDVDPAFEAAMEQISEGDICGIPIFDNLSTEETGEYGILNVVRTPEEEENPGFVEVPSFGAVQKLAAEYTDKTEAFSKQSDYSDPYEYLRSLGAGAWKVIDSGALYMTKIVNTGTVTAFFEKLISDDGFFYDEVWINDELVYSVNTETGETRVAGNKTLTDQDVAELEITTAATAVNDMASDNKLVTPAAVQALLDRLCPAPIVPTMIEDYSASLRQYDSSKTYAAGDKCYDYGKNDDYMHLFVRNDSEATGSVYADFEDKGKLFTLPDDTDMRQYEPAAQIGNAKLMLGSYLMNQVVFIDSGSAYKRLSFVLVTKDGNRNVNIYYDKSTGKVYSIGYAATGVSST